LEDLDLAVLVVVVLTLARVSLVALAPLPIPIVPMAVVDAGEATDGLAADGVDVVGGCDTTPGLGLALLEVLGVVVVSVGGGVFFLKKENKFPCFKLLGGVFLPL
jgi:hypothetical protein